MALLIFDNNPLSEIKEYEPGLTKIVKKAQLIKTDDEPHPIKHSNQNGKIQEKKRSKMETHSIKHSIQNRT